MSLSNKQLYDSRLKRINIIDVPITATNLKEFLSFIDENLNDVRGEYICVANAHTCVMAHDDPSYWEIQANSLMSVPDGKPLSFIGKRQISSMDRVSGPDLMREIFSISVDRGWRHYFYGNEQRNLDRLRNSLEEKYPGIVIAGMEPSVFRPLYKTEEESIVRRINDLKADFVWVGLGAPRQEELCSILKGKTNALMIGVGGAFNVLSNIIPEAPEWMQNVGLEWFYRLIQEPRRLFRRYLITNSKFIIYQLTKVKRKKG